uniref:F-box domain-containing protein n=1 Tax=Kalanchoe fedtschenkoi TaxID=63787 RepID=A0A7N0UF47_KALFE
MASECQPGSSVALTEDLGVDSFVIEPSAEVDGDQRVSGFSPLSIIDLPSALISEILKSLEPKELGVVACVSTVLHRLSSDHIVWKDFYAQRWGLSSVPKQLDLGAADVKTWKQLFVERVYMSKIFMGRYNVELLHGHTEAVRAVFILNCAKLVFTSGYDSVVRMWDLEDGLSIASSMPLGCTIRAVAADHRLLVAGATDGFIHCWEASEGATRLFELRTSNNQNAGFRLWEHHGPITCLSLDNTRIYSGSWDMTIRVWDRSVYQCVQVLGHSDWVWSLAPHCNTLASTSGSDLYLWDTASGAQIALVQAAHVGNSLGLARSQSGDLLFTGGEDGAIHMFQLRNDDGQNDCDVNQLVSWIPHTGPVHSLAFEYPWLVSASSDGKLSLLDIRVPLKTKKQTLRRNFRTTNFQKNPSKVRVEPPQRMLHGFGCNLFSVGIGAQRIVCGGDEGVVRIWNFSKALEVEQRARALRGVRLENRMRRRKLQTEMSGKSSRADQCSVAAKKNALNGDRSSSIWHNKRCVSGKLKA